MPKIFKDYLYQRYIEDILIFSFAPLLVITLIASRVPLTFETFIAIIINYLMYAFAFLYNDMEDRVEDANSPGKRFKNPFGYKVWSMSFGYLLLGIITVVSLAGSWWIGGAVTTLVALTNLLAGIVYSSKLLRLKDFLIIDVLTHCYLLAGAIVLYFMTLPGASNDTAAWLMFAGAVMASVAGDLLNEYRDFEDDRSAGLRNTASFLGKNATKAAYQLIYILAGITFTGGVLVLLGIIKL